MQPLSPVFSNPFGVSPAAADECASEPIHRPGHIQAPGVLIVFDPQDEVIRQVSSNSATLLGRTPGDLVGQSLDAIFREKVSLLLTGLMSVPVAAILTLKGSRPVPPLRVLAHQHAGLGYLELLPASWPDSEADLDQGMRDLVLSLGAVDTVVDYCQSVTEALRDLTGFERVLAYRFDEHYHGEVIAECVGPGVESYRGAWFPNNDIPTNARRLLHRVRVQAIANIHYTAVPMVPEIGDTGLAGVVPDLSVCLFRSVSPMCREFYHNMGVRATLIIGVCHGDRLWGMFACHHHAGPRPVSLPLLAACRSLSELISLQLTNLENQERLRAENRVHRLTDELGQAMSEAEPSDWLRVLGERGPDLLQLVGASGAAIAHGERLGLVGVTPSAHDVARIVSRIREHTPDGVFSSAALPFDFSDLVDLTATVSGVLFVPLSRQEGSFIAWFRQERSEPIHWAGVPIKPMTTVNGRDRLHPRRSFEAFHAQVAGTSRPWSETDRAVAERMRSSLLGLVLEAVAFRRALAETDLLLVRRALSASSEAAAVFDAHGQAHWTNPAFERLLGKRPADLPNPAALGRLFADPAVGAAAVAAVSDGGEWSAETTMLGPAGPVPVAVRLDLVRADGGAGPSAGHIGLFIDLTEPHRLQQQLQQAQRLESLGVMAGGVAHDFNNLLTSILGHASLATMALPADSPALESLTHVDTAGRQAAELCHQMLAFAGRARLTPGPVNLGALVREMNPLFAALMGKTARLRLELGEVPTVRADATQFRQVLMNLIVNGTEAIGANEGLVTVRTAAVTLGEAELAKFPLERLPPGEYVRLEVSDTGSGMPEEVRARVFEPFYSTKFTGRGLGLAAVLGIVRGHRGGIRVESRPGEGSTFTIVLPASTESAVERKPTVTATNVVNRLVMVVDDDAGVLRVARVTLERAGYGVITAASGAECLTEFAKHGDAVGVVLMDLTMPGLSGLETAAELWRVRPTLPVVLSSGYSEEPTDLQLGGPATFLVKPYRATELLRMIGNALGA